MAATADRKAYHREWYVKNRDKRLAQTKAYQAQHQEEYKQRNTQWQRDNRERMSVIQKKSHHKHAEKRNRENKEWYATRGKLPEFSSKMQLRRRKYYEANKDRIAERNKAWRLKNKPKIKARDMKRRALKKSATINLAQIQAWVERIKNQKTVCCYYCQLRVSTNRIHFDHVIALDKGGPHSIENLCVACPECNLSKKAKSISAWVRIGQQVLAL